MASQTLVEAKKFFNDQITAGVAQDIIDINPMFNFLPFTGYAGSAILVNRENALGDAAVFAVDATITSKAASTQTQVPFTATKLIGDVELDGLVKVQSAGGGVDLLTHEISSKAKSIGRLFQTGIATGSGSSPQMNSLHSMCDAGQYTTASAGQALSFALLDELSDLILAKDGQVDWFMMAARTLRSYKVLLRALGGVTAMEVMTMPNGEKVITYEGVPVFKNTYLSVVETANGAALTTGVLTSVWGGVWDDGSNKVGVAGVHPIEVPAGIIVEPIGGMEAKDNQIVRVKQYANFASFNRKGIARLPSINN